MKKLKSLQICINKIDVYFKKATDEGIESYWIFFVNNREEID